MGESLEPQVEKVSTTETEGYTAAAVHKQQHDTHGMVTAVHFLYATAARTAVGSDVAQAPRTRTAA